MGYYINPTSGTKEDWLAANGVPLSLKEVRTFDFGSAFLPVCLVDNGPFTAAGIAFDAGERDAFDYPDHRPKRWYAVPRDKLKPWYS